MKNFKRFILPIIVLLISIFSKYFTEKFDLFHAELNSLLEMMKPGMKQDAQKANFLTEEQNHHGKG